MDISELLLDEGLALRFNEYISTESLRLSKRYGLERTWVEAILRDTVLLTDENPRYWKAQVEAHGFSDELFFSPDLEEIASGLPQGAHLSEKLQSFYSLPKIQYYSAIYRDLKESQPALNSKHETLALLKKYREFLEKNHSGFTTKGYADSPYPFSHFNHFIPRVLLSECLKGRLAAEAEWQYGKSIEEASKIIEYRDLFSADDWKDLLGHTSGLKDLREKLYNFLADSVDTCIQAVNTESTLNSYQSIAELILKHFNKSDLALLYKIEQRFSEENAHAVDLSEYDGDQPPEVKISDLAVSCGSLGDILFFVGAVLFEAEIQFSRQAQVRLAPFLSQTKSGYRVFDPNFFEAATGDKSKHFFEALDFWSEGHILRKKFFLNFDERVSEALDNNWLEEYTITISRKNNKAMKELMARLEKIKDPNEILARLLILEGQDKLSQSGGQPVPAIQTTDRFKKLEIKEYSVKGSSFSFGHNFRSLKYDGKLVDNFNEEQSLVMEKLYNYYQRNDPDVPAEVILDMFRVNESRKTALSMSGDIFKRSHLWGKFVISATKGTYRINPTWVPSEEDFFDNRQNKLRLLKPKKSKSKRP